MSAGEGGLAAFRVAVENPDLFHCLAVLPGWPAPSDLRRIETISAIPVKMWSGEDEHPTRLDLMRQTQEKMSAGGGDVELEIRSGEGHNLRSMRGGEDLFDYLQEQRKKRSPSSASGV